ncbi:hypothetical protein [Aquabacterium sp.]|uniref:hypothetical protein n=1 Tax=Aquabacterium sp. TaxID=1872578 RepID=UPI0035AF28F9
MTMIVLALFGSDICSVMIQLFATPQRPQPTSQVSVVRYPHSPVVTTGANGGSASDNW